MPRLIVDLALPAERYLVWYQGRAERVLMHARDGRSISLPAHHLRRFLSREGIYGSFELEFTEQGQLLDIRRLDAG